MAVFARNHGEYRQRGATIAAVVIDAPEQNAAMTAKLALPFSVYSDADGAGAIKPFAVWDDPGKMAKPAIVLLAPDGREVYRYTGVDFMDRPLEGELVAALDTLRLPPLLAATAIVPHLDPAPGPRAIDLHDLSVYLRGVRWSSRALAGRARDPWDREEAARTSAMAERYIAAVAETRRLTGASV